MESFFRTHKYLVEHLDAPVRRGLMDEINSHDRLIGIKGSRGVGKTTFLLNYAKEFFGVDNRECLYVNLNHFYFTERSLSDFASEFCERGGKVLLIDQVFKYPGWAEELCNCYDNLPELKIIFSGSSVMRLKEDNPELSERVISYNLRGFSFREFLNLMAGCRFQACSLQEILEDHRAIAQSVCSMVNPLDYFQAYLHHGFYPFFLEKRNFSENLLKTMNMMLEVDLLFIKQIEQRYLSKVRKLLYLLAVNAPGAPNVSQLSKEIGTSRATVMNYIKYLTDARLLNMLYPVEEEFPRKPSKVYMYNSNLMYPIRPMAVNPALVRETFFFNQLLKANQVNAGNKNAHFLINGMHRFRIEEEDVRLKNTPELYYAVDQTKVGDENRIPLWLFGFLY